MVDLNMPLEGSQEGSNVEVRNVDLMDDGVESHDSSAIRDPMMEQYEVNPDDGDNADEEPPEIPDDGDEEEEMNYYSDTQIALTQPAISQPYDRPDHFTSIAPTNIFECINAVMKGFRNLPITALVKSSYFCLGELFARKGSEALAIEFNSKHVNTMNVYQFDRSRSNFTVEELAAVSGSTV
ncbi:hypothetical protein AHAS_Ahas03G0122800 [Arachis hypogaea]